MSLNCTGSNENLGRMFSSGKYAEARLLPDMNDDLYFHLKDLLSAIQQLKFEDNCKVLDFGCGLSPYESIINHSEYHKADYIYGDIKLDIEIKDGKIPDACSNYYDYVISTQVLEHVTSVSGYLAEARRVLNGRGKLVLTTHGIFGDHPCPTDYWRWTADGLALEMERSGFRVVSIHKLTGGARFFFTFLEDSLNSLALMKSKFGRFVIKIMRKLFYFSRFRLITLLDAETAHLAAHLVTKVSPGPDKYVAIMIVAEKDDSRR